MSSSEASEAPPEARVVRLRHLRDARSISLSEEMSPPTPVAVDQQGADARPPRAPATSSSGVSPTCSASSGPQPGELERRREDRRVGLARAGHGRAHRPVEQPAEPAALQHPGKRAVPVGDGDQPLASVPQLAQGRHGVGIGAEADRLDQLVDGDLDAEPLRDERGAALAQVGERGLVPPLVRVVAVVGHLGAERRREPLVAHLVRNAVAQGEPGRLELDQGAERVEKHSADHPANTARPHDPGSREPELLATSTATRSRRRSRWWSRS